MNSKVTSLIATVVFSGATLLAGNAQASLLNASYSATVLGEVSIVGSDLNNATEISFTSGDFLITNVLPDFLGEPNDFAGGEVAPGDIGSIVTPLSITGFSPVSNFLTWTGASGAGYFFDLSSLTRNPSSSGAMDLFGVGTFGANPVGAAPFDVIDDNTAAFRLTAQQVGNTISASFSFGTPPFENPVPAPGTLGLIGGMLAGLALLRRRARRFVA